MLLFSRDIGELYAFDWTTSLRCGLKERSSLLLLDYIRTNLIVRDVITNSRRINL